MRKLHLEGLTFTSNESGTFMTIGNGIYSCIFDNYDPETGRLSFAGGKGKGTISFANPESSDALVAFLEHGK